MLLDYVRKKQFRSKKNLEAKKAAERNSLFSTKKKKKRENLIRLNVFIFSYNTTGYKVVSDSKYFYVFS